jgi:hypothetical protein
MKIYCPYCKKEVAVQCGKCGSFLGNYFIPILGAGVGIRKCKKCKSREPICSDCGGQIHIK